MLFRFARRKKSTQKPSRRNAPSWKLSLEPLEDRTLPSVLSLVGGTLRYTETSGSNHSITVSFRPDVIPVQGRTGVYTITDNENFTSLPAGWTGVGTTTAVGPDTGIADHDGGGRRHDPGQVHRRGIQRQQRGGE